MASKITFTIDKLIQVKNVFTCICRRSHTCKHEDEDWEEFYDEPSQSWKKVDRFTRMKDGKVYPINCYQRCPFCARRCHNSLCRVVPLYSCRNSTLDIKDNSEWSELTMTHFDPRLTEGLVSASFSNVRKLD